jgi:hypothetical protein
MNRKNMFSNSHSKILIIVVYSFAVTCFASGLGQQPEPVPAARDSLSSPAVVDSVTQKQGAIGQKDTLSGGKIKPAAATPDSATAAAPDTIKYDFKDIHKPLIRSLSLDSTLIRGSDYGSFADVFDVLPGSFYFNRGSTGQPAFGSLFAGIGEKMALTYDGLELNDLLTGQADLNLVPTESVHTIDVLIAPQSRRDAFQPLGQTVQLSSYQLAQLPIRSRVAYRTGGNGYDDIDVRLGVQPTAKFAINLGGILKNYGGTTLHEKYRGQKVNLKLDRFINRSWSVHYVMLYNVFDLDSPPHSPVFPGYLHHKDARFDHGITIKKDHSLSILIQYSRLHREVYNPNRSTLSELHEADQFRLAGQWQRDIGLFQLSAGGQVKFVRLTKSDWGEHRNDRAGLFVNLSRHWQRFRWHAGGRLEKFENQKPSLQPELFCNYSLRDSSNVFLWLQRRSITPSLQVLYENDKFALGNTALLPEEFNDCGIGFEKTGKRLAFFTSLSYSYQRRVISSVQQAEMTQSLQPLLFQNFPRHSFASADLNLQLTVTSWLALAGKVKFIYQEKHDLSLRNVPALFSHCYLQVHKILFKKDLNMYLRLGFTCMDKRDGGWYLDALYAPVGTVNETLDGFIIPYIQGIFHIKDATLFVSMQNAIGNKYQRMYGFSMPESQLRWGFVWNFIN